MPRDGRWERLAGVLGVTRVARVTGLDRSGVEVACAVRPGGHVLQVSNGKAERWDDARRGALLEAAELWASERVDSTALVYGRPSELSRQGRAFLDAADLGSGGALLAPRLWSDETWMGWREGLDLVSGAKVLVPACSVHCPPAGSPPIGPAVTAWTSNGMGAHPSREQALLHALLEAVERDQVARALPSGWTRAAVSGRMVEPGSLPRRSARLWTRVQRGGFQAYLFDLTPPGRSRLGLPVGGAILVDMRSGPVPVTAGYACALQPDDALASALLEAAQSRLTDIHGAREDVAHRAGWELAGWCARSRPRRRAAAMPRLRGRGPDAVVRKLREAGRRRVVAVELDSPEGVHVLKVVVPGLAVSELY